MDYIRINAAQCGATLGKYILVVERNPVDTNYSEDKKNGALTLSRPVYLYSIRPIEVTSVELVESMSNERKVQFNKDPKLRLDIANIDDITKVIPVPSASTVKAAIEKYERSNKEEITIFVDYVKLVPEVMALNRDEKNVLQSFLNAQMKFCGTLVEANELEATACRTRMKELGIDVNI